MYTMKRQYTTLLMFLLFCSGQNQSCAPDGWHSFGNSIYRVETFQRTFADARIACQSYGGDLALIKSTETNSFLASMAPRLSTAHTLFWFGLHDIGNEGRFVWIDGTTLDSRLNLWYPGEPNNAGNEDCASFRTDAIDLRQRGHGKWNDVPCAIVLQFICEKDLVPCGGPPVHLLAVTPTPYGGGLADSRYLCLLSPPDVVGNVTSTQRLVRLSDSDDSFIAPGSNIATPNSLPVAIEQVLPPNNTAVGIYQCTATSPDGRITTVSITMLSDNRRFQPADGRFTQAIYPGDTITLNVTRRDTYAGNVSDISWQTFSDFNIGIERENDDNLSYTITSATINDADTYGTFEVNRMTDYQYSLVRLMVQACPSGKWNPRTCRAICDNCYNGGVCHQQSGTCICPPGFAGTNCLTACGKDRYGWECELQCGPGMALDTCAGSQFCMPDPYGCNCLAGYSGIYCNESCIPGKFGAACSEDCHCSHGSCNIYTGECPDLGGCDAGWSGPSCQIPTVCPVGYQGVNCTERCHCVDNGACEKDTGYCLESGGLCDVGYTADSTLTDNCKMVSGCFDSCSKTCHCSGGEADCDTVTGDCFSSICHPRWTGDKCQTDRVQSSIRKSNPGRAHVFCAITAENTHLPIAAVDIKIAVGEVSSESRTILYSDSSVSGIIRNNSFVIENLFERDVVYCYTGVPPNGHSFAYARIEISYCVLPVLIRRPNVLAVGYSFLVIRWTRWIGCVDIGDGPITGYNVYMKTINGKWIKKEYLEAPTSPTVGHTLDYNVTGLQAETEYMLSVSTIREGGGGEGARGPELAVRTRPISMTATSLGSDGSPGAQSTATETPWLSWALFAVSLAVICIFVSVGVIVRFRAKRKRFSTPFTQNAAKTTEQPAVRYRNVLFTRKQTGEDTYEELSEKRDAADSAANVELMEQDERENEIFTC